MSDLLVDSSIWIDFFHGAPNVVRRLDAALEQDRVAVCGPIVAEVLSGTRTHADFARVKAAFEGLALLPDPVDAWPRVGEARFALARRGTQAALVDVLIALTAAEASHALLTRDSDFRRIATVVPVELEKI
ncbi:MAG TPA: PIN domain-containing protein [Thermoanaerobaculia bacterium]|nr:PIN domain-containing protein [Thermoanaerobaculia bacterium]